MPAFKPKSTRKKPTARAGHGVTLAESKKLNAILKAAKKEGKTK